MREAEGEGPSVYSPDYWLYFFIHFDDPHLKTLFAEKDETGILVKACEALSPNQWSEEDLTAYAKAQKAIALKQTALPPEMELARRDAFREGVEANRKESVEEQRITRKYELLLESIEQGNRDVMAMAKKFGLAPHEVRNVMKQAATNRKFEEERIKTYGF